jgi:hypothetical protein
MRNENILLTLILIVSFLIVYKTLFITTTCVEETQIDDILYYRIDDNINLKKPSYDIHQVFNDVSAESNITFKKSRNFYQATFILFLSLDNIDRVMPVVNYPMKTTHIYGICATDSFVSKSSLYKHFKEAVPSSILEKILPITFNLDNPKDVKLLKSKKESQEVVYLAKKNIQRQQGFSIFKDPMTKLEKDYVVVQEMLQNPYLVNGRKINIRVYLLIVIENTKVDFYVYKNGFVYYTPELFEKYSTDINRTITTGYIDRNVYKDNPLTLEDLETFMGKKDYDKMMNNTLFIMKCLKDVFEPILAENNRLIRCKKFLIYGCDIAPSDDLGSKLIEINKGPDLGYKDERDKHVKFNMVKNTLEIVGLSNDRGFEKNYIKI